MKHPRSPRVEPRGTAGDEYRLQAAWAPFIHAYESVKHQFPGVDLSARITTGGVLNLTAKIKMPMGSWITVRIYQTIETNAWPVDYIRVCGEMHAACLAVAIQLDETMAPPIGPVLSEAETEAGFRRWVRQCQDHPRMFTSRPVVTAGRAVAQTYSFPLPASSAKVTMSRQIAGVDPSIFFDLDIAIIKAMADMEFRMSALAVPMSDEMREWIVQVHMERKVAKRPPAQLWQDRLHGREARRAG